MIWILWTVIGVLVVVAAFAGYALTVGEARREDSADCGADEGRWPDRWNTWEDDRF